MLLSLNLFPDMSVFESIIFHLLPLFLHGPYFYSAIDSVQSVELV